MNRYRHIFSAFKFVILMLLCMQSGSAFGKINIVNADLDLETINQMIKDQGVRKAFKYSISESQFNPENRSAYARMEEFFGHIENADEEWFSILNHFYLGGMVDGIYGELLRDAVGSALSKKPEVVFAHWKKIGYDTKCGAYPGNAGDPEPAYILVPKALYHLLGQKRAVTNIQGKTFETVKVKCLSQIEFEIKNEKSYARNQGIQVNDAANFKVRFTQNKIDPIPLPSVNEINKEIRLNNDKGLYQKITLFDWLIEIDGWSFNRWNAYIDQISTGNQDWLRVTKNIYSKFYNSYEQGRNIAVGDGLTSDPATVFSILKEELSKENELKNVCGNTYEDLLWGVAVEEQVIGVAREKLETRKKALVSMKNEKLSDMKNQCIQAIDSSLAIWKGRVQ